MNIKILAMNILVPILAIIAIAALLGRFKVKEPGEEGSFFQRFLKFFTQTYEYEKYK